MLGQLFHSFNPARHLSSRSASFESDTENLHTKALLFPDSTFLREPDAISPSFPTLHPVGSQHLTDCSHGDLDLECPRDIRILVAQGETISSAALLLFDSKPPSNPSSPLSKQVKFANYTHHARTTSGPSRQHVKQPSIEPIPESSGRETPTLVAAPTIPTTQRSQTRRASLSTAQSNFEHVSAMRQKESDEMARTVLDCMFENLPTTYKGITNKIHVVPLESRAHDVPSTSFTTSTMGNSFANQFGRGSTVRRPSSLSSSYTPMDTPTSVPKDESAIEDLPLTEPRRRHVFVTRIFSINWTDDDVKACAVPRGGPSNVAVRQARMRKLKPPMFAITVVLNLPLADHELSSLPPSRSGPPTTVRRKGSDTHTGQNSLGSSVESERPAGWALTDPFSGLNSSVMSSEVDDRVDLIGQHWDILQRTITTIQSLVEERILLHLKLYTSSGRDPMLQHMNLASDKPLMTAADVACSRIIRGIKIPRVRTGQGRWGIWRDEARWLNKWASGKEKNAFFFHLITAFLGTHTEWLNVIGPKQFRRRLREQRRGEDLSVPSRTIIVSNDKMAARRLVFLLAAFLPANYHMRDDASPLRPGTSASLRAYSESPPSRTAPSRQESLRRTINRRTKRSTSGQPEQMKTTQLPNNVPEIPDGRTEAGATRVADGEGQFSRRGSDTISLMSSKAASTDVESTARKSTATTSATATPDTAFPVTHLVRKFPASEQGVATVKVNKGESLASEKLMNALQRDSTGTTLVESQPASRWTGLKSLWSSSTHRDFSSSEMTDNDEGLGISGLRHSDRLRGKLQQMVDEGEVDRLRSQQENPEPNSVSPEDIPITPELTSPPLEQSTPHHSDPIDVPLKTSVNQRDGVIDVEITLPGWGSPSQSHHVPTSHYGSSLGSHAQSSLMSYGARDNDHPMNVAGMLGKLHPDFELQAVQPYPELHDDIKEAMRRETIAPRPRAFADSKPVEEWVDVCTSLITDTSTHTITRVRLRRLIRFLPPTPQPLGPGPQISTAKSQYGNPYSPAQLSALPTHITLEEKFDESKVRDVDSDLIFIIERVLSESGTPSQPQSMPSSRSSSQRGRKPTAGDLARIEIPQEIPHSECKRMVIGALEQIATAVAREREDKERYGEALLRRVDDGVESTLRNGIRKRYEDVEKDWEAAEKIRRMEKAAARAAQESDDARTIRPAKRSLQTSPVPISAVTMSDDASTIQENRSSCSPPFSTKTESDLEQIKASQSNPAMTHRVRGLTESNMLGRALPDLVNKARGQEKELTAMKKETVRNEEEVVST